MRIAQIAPLYLPVPPDGYGGTERVVGWLADGLVDRGHDVTLFAAEGSVTQADQVAICPPLLDRRHPSDALARAEEAIMMDVVRARAPEFDMLHFHTDFVHYPLFAKCPTPSVTTLHWRVDEEDRQRLFGHFRDATLIAISHDQRSRLPADVTDVTVIHHGMPRDLLTAGLGDGGYLAFLGRMSPQKRPEWAIEVARSTGMPLRLAGSADHGNDDYFERTISPHLGETVSYVGEVSGSAREEFIRDAAALLFPLDWPEPFGLVMIEAMAAGTPVVAWDNGSAREVLSDDRAGVVVSNIDEAIAALPKVLDLSRKGVRAAFENRFEAGRMVAAHEAAYAEAIHRNQRDQLGSSE